MPTSVEIAPAHGRLGVLLVGLGAVSTTTIAGVFAIRKGLAKPIGSLTQMGTIRLGKRTEGRSPKINDFVPLAQLNDIVFGGWDIFEDNCYEAAKHAGVLEEKLLDQIKTQYKEQGLDAEIVFEDMLVSRDRVRGLARQPIHPEDEDLGTVYDPKAVEQLFERVGPAASLRGLDRL